MKLKTIINTHLFASDPTCRTLPDGRFWIFATHDQCSVQFQAPPDYWDNMYSYQAYSTNDFLTWVHHGSILDRFDIKWATANCIWDGDAGIAANGMYYAYIPVRTNVDNLWQFQMAVMVSEHPEGPYRDALMRPFLTGAEIIHQGFRVNPEREGGLCLSPTVIWGDDGSPWLLFGQFYAFIAPLRQDMLGFSGPIRMLDIPLFGGNAHEYIEGPMLHKIGGRWLFSYMTYKNWQGKLNNNFTDDDPAGPYIQVCESDSMFGPFTNPRHWIYPNSYNDCNIQHCMAPFNGKWIAVYHLPWRQGSEYRQLHCTEMDFDSDNRLVKILPNEAKPIGRQEKHHVLYSAYGNRYFIECHASQGVIQKQGPLKAHHVEMYHGGFLRFDDIAFGEQNKKKSIIIEMIQHESHNSGELEIRLDNINGLILAKHDCQSEQCIQGRIVIPISNTCGNRTLYFVALCKDLEIIIRSKPLFRLLSFKFVDDN